MAAAPLCKRLLSRPRTYRSFCQVTQMRGSYDLMESHSPPDPMPYGMKIFDIWYGCAEARYAPSSYTPIIFDYIDDSDCELDDEYKAPPVRIEYVGPRSKFLRLNVHSLDPPSISLYNRFMKAFLSDYPKDRLARPYIVQMLVHGAIPDLFTFSVFIKSYCKHHTYQHVHEAVFTQMKALGVKPNSSFYKLLMGGVCAHFGPIVGYQLLKELRSSHGIQMPLSCYNAIVRQLCWKKLIVDPEMVLVLIDVLMDMKQQRILPDEKICSSLLRGRGHGVGGEGFLKAVGIGRQMFAMGIRTRAVSPLQPCSQRELTLDLFALHEPEPEPYVTLMIKRRYAPDCVLVYMHMSNPLPPSVDEMNFNLKMLVRHKLKPKIGRSFLAQMLIRGTIPNLYSFYLVIDSYCKHLTYQHIHDLFFTQMKALEVEADTSFYITLMNRVCNCFKPNVGFQLFKKLRSSYRVQTPLSCYDAVVRQLGKMEMMDEEAGLLLIDVLIDMKQQRIFPDEKLYNYLLKVRSSGSERFLKAIGIGKLMFAESIRTGAVSSKPDKDMWKGMEAEETWAFRDTT